MWKTNCPVNLSSIIQISKEHVAVEKALIFEISGLFLWLWKLQNTCWICGFQKQMRFLQILRLCKVWMPLRKIKLINFENLNCVLKPCTDVFTLQFVINWDPESKNIKCCSISVFSCTMEIKSHCSFPLPFSLSSPLASTCTSPSKSHLQEYIAYLFCFELEKNP